MEKITITPQMVRGLGDIAETKTTNDYTGATIHQTTSIIGGVETPIFSFNNDNLTIVASNPYMMTGETTDLTITLKNGLGEPLPNKTVTVTGTDSSSYSGITNSNGVFALYNISVSADTTFTATYSNVSATVKVEYCTFVDYAVTGNANSNYSVGSAITKTVGQNYTTLSTDSANSSTGRTYSTTSFSGNIELLLEVDKGDANTNWAFYIGFRASSNHSLVKLLANGWRYIKVQRNSGTCTAYISTDGNSWEAMAMDSDNVGAADVNLELYIYTNTSGKAVKFKNVRVKAL